MTPEVKYHELPESEREKLKEKWREEAVIREKNAKFVKDKKMAAVLLVCMPLISGVLVLFMVLENRPIKFLGSLIMICMVVFIRELIWYIGARRKEQAADSNGEICISKSSIGNQTDIFPGSIVSNASVYNAVSPLILCTIACFGLLLISNWIITYSLHGKPGEYLLNSVIVVLPIYIFVCIYAVRDVYIKSKWVINEKYISCGDKGDPCVYISEVISVYVGLGYDWVPSGVRFPNKAMVESFRNDAILFILKGNRYLLWNFDNIVNRDVFVDKILSLCHRENMDVPQEILQNIKFSDNGKIIQI